MTTTYSLDLHTMTANTIRGLAMDGVQKANSGHPGLPMGMADVATVLWSKYLKHNPAHPDWVDRDRFVLSAGHGSMLLYSLLYLSGYDDVSLEQLGQFRQWGSFTPGHPEHAHPRGVEMTTGPLGQGISSAVGMAIAERWLAAQFNRPDYDVVDHHTYVIASDGDMMEGISHESCALAGHLGLGKLIVYWDDNHISIDGRTEITFTEDVLARFAAYGWHTQRIDGHDPQAIIAATDLAHAETARPSIIACRTKIGFGSPNKEDTPKAHGEPLGADEIRLTKERLGLPPDEDFYVASESRAFLTRDGQRYAAWQRLWHAYGEAHPTAAIAYQDALAGKLPKNWDEILPKFEDGRSAGTRVYAGEVLNAIAPHIPNLIGGSADLAVSNKSTIKGSPAMNTGDFGGRNINFGVREHGMGAILNGMQLHGGVRPFGATFLVFSDYMRGAVRLAAIMGLPVIFFYTHDSIGVGEDGPTHQPIEQLMSLRLIPELTVIRPADGTETAYAWQAALENQSGPTALVFSRQNSITHAESGAGALRGGYVLRDAEAAQVILIGTGTEVQIALDAADLLDEQGIATRVVSMPSWELFERQSQSYRDSVLLPQIGARVSVEAGVTSGWQRYVGANGRSVGLDQFGSSAPYAKVYEELGMTAEHVAQTAAALLG